MAFITAAIAAITTYWPYIVGAVYALISLGVAVFNKNEKVVGILGFIRKVFEHLSALQPRNSAGSVKLPGAPASPTVPTPIVLDSAFIEPED